MTLLGMVKNGEWEERFFCPLKRRLFDICTADSVREIVFLNLHCIGFKCGLFDRKRGQMRRNLLLRPAYCHISYYAYKWCSRRHVCPTVFSLPLFCSLSHSPLHAFGLAQAVASLLTLSSHFSKASPRERLKITLIGCMAGTKGKGGLVIHLFYSLLRVVLKDLPTLSAQARS